MDLVSGLRTLWRLRLLVALVGLLSVLAGLAIAYRIQLPASLTSRQYHVGVAAAQALVDTPRSQVVDLGGADDVVKADIATLSARASLLANLMTNSPMREEIARRAGIPANRLIAIPPPSATPGAVAPTGGGPGVTARLSDPDANVLRITIPELQSGQIPIISIDAQAPDEAGAARLADQAIAVLRDHLSSVASTDAVPDQRRVVVRELGRAQSSVQARGPGKKAAVGMTLFLFLLGCGAILGVTALASGWRRQSALEQSLLDGAASARDPAEGAGSPVTRFTAHELEVDESSWTAARSGETIAERRA